MACENGVPAAKKLVELLDAGFYINQKKKAGNKRILAARFGLSSYGRQQTRRGKTSSGHIFTQ
ncbi:MAG: hypothetical protein EA359_03330 [Balneolaceae bacterium]|nr:MAG: hypothetical protein EA359_03330 [Balneolaceae bacterium]